MSRRDSEDFTEELRDSARLLRGMHRRMAIRRTTSVKWQLLGQRGGQGGDELVELETFPGIGIYARPPSSGKPEAITAAVGGAKTSVVVATRDEKTRKAVADIAEGETCVYNGPARLVLKADGTVEIRLHGGAAFALALKSDVAKIETALAGATIVPGDGGASLKATIIAGLATSLHGAAGTTPWPVGTTVLKGQ